MILGLAVALHNASTVAGEQVGEGVAGGESAAGIEGKKAIDGRLELGQFIFLRGQQIPAKLEVVLAPNLGNVVAIFILRIGVHGAVRDPSSVLRNAVEDAAAESKARNTIAVVEARKAERLNVRRTLPRPADRGTDVVG